MSLRILLQYVIAHQDFIKCIAKKTTRKQLQYKIKTKMKARCKLMFKQNKILLSQFYCANNESKQEKISEQQEFPTYLKGVEKIAKSNK